MAAAPRTSIRRLTAWARFARALLTANLRSALASRRVFALQVSFMVLNNLTFFVFWWVLFSRVPHLAGWRLDDVEALFGLAAVSIGLVEVVGGGVRHLSRTIENGELDTLLAQPKPVLLHAAGRRSHAAGVGDMVSGAVFLVLSGYVTATNVPLVALTVLAAATVFFATSVILFSLAFWLDRTEAISRLLRETLIALSLYPEPLFSGTVRVVLFTVVPAGFITYLPLRVIRDASLLDAVLLVAAAVGYLVMAVWMFQRGLRRYSSGSRFSIIG